MKDFLKRKNSQLIVSSEEMKLILDSLEECLELIELNTHGLVIDEKDTARAILHRWGYMNKPKRKKPTKKKVTRKKAKR